jgi:hypothetical protein
MPFRLEWSQGSPDNWQVVPVGPDEITPITLVGVSAQTAATTSAISVAQPANTLPGDFIVVMIAAGGDSPATTDVISPSGIPAGFQRVGPEIFFDYGAGGNYFSVYVGVAESPTGGNLVFQLACETGTGGGIYGASMAWRGVDVNNWNALSGSPQTSEGFQSTTSQTLTPLPISTAVNGAMVVSMVVSSDDNNLQFEASPDTSQGFTLSGISGSGYDSTTGSDSAMGMAYRLVSTAGSVTMPTWFQQLVSADTWIWRTLVLRPISTPATVYVAAASGSPAGFVDGAGTTAQLDQPGNSPALFVSGAIVNSQNELQGSPTVSLSVDQYTEIEWCLRFAATASGSYNFRVTDGGVALDSYAVTASATIGDAGRTANATLLERPDLTSASGTVAVMAAGVLLESRDSTTAQGSVSITGNASLAEQPDSSSAQAGAAISASATLTEQADTLSATASVAQPPAAVVLSASAQIGSPSTLATTAQLTPPAGKTAAAYFTVGQLSDQDNPLPGVFGFGENQYTELEWAIEFTETAQNGEVYEFRVVFAGSPPTPLDFYQVTPTLAVGPEAYLTTVEGADTLSAEVVSSTGADAALIEISDVISSAVTVSVAGSASLLERPDTLTAATSVAISGTATLVEAADVTSASAGSSVTAAAALLERPDTLSSTSTVAVTAMASLSERPDSMASSAASSITAAASLAERPDLLSASAATSIAASATLQERPDVLDSQAGAAGTAQGALVERADSLVSSGTVAVSGQAALLEAPDATTGAGSVSVTGNASLLEAGDSLTAFAAGEGSLFRLEFRKQESPSGAWQVVPVGSPQGDVYISNSTSIIDGSATTAQLAQPANSPAVFTSGWIWDASNAPNVGSVTLDSERYTEIEWALRFSTSALGAYEFRVTDNGTVLDSYPVNPVATVLVARTAAAQVVERSDTLSSEVLVGAVDIIESEPNPLERWFLLAGIDPLDLSWIPNPAILTVAGPLTADASLIERSDVLASSASVAISGSAALLEAPDTLQADGIVTAGGAIVDASLLEQPDTLASSASAQVSASGALLEAGDALASSGVVSISGSASLLEAADRLSADGIVTAGGAVVDAALVERPDLLSSSAAVSVTAAASLAEAPDSVSSLTSVAISGTASLLEAADLIASEGGAAVFANGSLVERPDTLAASASTTVTASASLAEAADLLASAATVSISATASLAEAQDLLTSEVSVAIVGNASLLERPDTTESIAGAGLLCIALLTERPDTLASTGTVSVTATAAILEAPDATTGAVTVPVTATAAITEQRDTLDAQVVAGISGSATLTERPDLLSADGIVFTPGRLGSANIVEEADRITASGQVSILAAAVIVEAGDIVVSSAGAAVTGTVLALEAPDFIEATAFHDVTASAAIVEAPDRMTASLLQKIARRMRVSDSLAGHNLSISDTRAGGWRITTSDGLD